MKKSKLVTVHSYNGGPHTSAIYQSKLEKGKNQCVTKHKAYIKGDL